MRKAAPPTHRIRSSADGRRRSLAALGARCVEEPVLASAGLAALQAALRTIPSRRVR
ncbi:MAG TPA: hypothetical protein VFL14_01795 [Xanthomonadales bacterium]|nr:hypothetical protein [Xanthomonadales bacterium]